MIDSARDKWVDYVVLGLSLFLVFCLIFDSYIVLPRLVAWVGHWHPLVLHFPIVLLLICAFLGLTNKKIPSLLFKLTVLLTLITAISGFFLGKESGSKGELLFWHQWLGGALALLAALWYWLHHSFLKKGIVFKLIQVIIICLVLFTGHFGGMVTHGEEFLALPTAKRQEQIPKNPLIYGDVVSRILDDKCVSCHNPNKKKGELLLNSFEGLLAGGELGKTIVPLNVEESELINRLHLPVADEEHMPPEGKMQLTETEIQILERWIALGASDTLRLNHLASAETLVGLIKGLMKPDAADKWKKFSVVDDSTIANLSSDYVTIKRVASNLNALSVVVFKPPSYDSSAVVGLKRVAENIVELDLSDLPIGTDEMSIIKVCSNLERLELDKTPVGDDEVKKLSGLNNLKFLKIFKTNITDESLKVFKGMTGLNSLYLGQSKVTKSGVNSLKLEKPDLLIIDEIDEEIESFFIATDSVPKI
ncbi:c-type cytochrome domain-containing protein [Aurantibacter sp.]|uniref:c-type cytochrome domain-containing protein n=1 Tax=Aurantibacter sp. TaxID=2807103 RepID=UPI0032631F44